MNSPPLVGGARGGEKRKRILYLTIIDGLSPRPACRQTGARQVETCGGDSSGKILAS